MSASHVYIYTSLGYIEHCIQNALPTFAHVVLSTLYQEKMVTQQDLEELKRSPGIWLWYRLVHCQCTKPPDVITRTAELLDSIDQTLEANILRG